MHARLAFLAAILAAVGSCTSYTSPTQPLAPTAAKAYLEEVIRVMEANSLHRYRINWTDFRNGVFGRTPSAQTIADTYPAIESALRLLADDHSSYRTATGALLMVRNRNCTAGPPAAVTRPSDIGYVAVGSFTGSTAEGAVFAQNIQDAIRTMDEGDMRGWIVDLRGNVGGNMWPMIAGLGPVLGEGTLGYFIDPDGVESAWEYRDGASRSNGTALSTVGNPYRLRRERPRVAVLTDERVVSSGEATAIAFRGRADTRSFGTPTCGLSTANRGFTMSDGAFLNLTVSLMADRTKAQYGDVVVPDEVLPDSAQAVQRAIAWLQGGS